MHKYLKRTVTVTATAAVLAGQMTGVGIMNASAESELNKKFHVENADPSKVMWTSTMVENVDEDYGNVNPNADNKDNSGHQNPYNNPGENFTSWAYAEYLWTYSYPVGNGRMAGMVAGGIDKEIIQINEDTVWDGSPYGSLYDENGNIIDDISEVKNAQTITMRDQTGGSVKDNWKYFRGADSDGAPAPIGSAGAVVGDEAFREAYPDYADKSISNQALAVSNAHTTEAVQQRYAMERMVEAKFLGNPTRQKAYKSFVEVYLDFSQNHSFVTNYTKSLDMETGVVMVDYDYLGTHFTRETFASYPDQTVATHIESDKELDFTAQLHSYHNQDGYYTYERISDREIKLTASVYNGNKNGTTPAGVNAIRFEARMLLDGDGVFTVSEDNSSIGVKGGKDATIYVVGATNYVDYKHLDNSKPSADCEKYIANIKSRSYDDILARHTADFTEQFNSSSLHIDNINGVDNYNVPTEKRIRKDINGKSGFLTGAGSKLDSANKNGVYTTYSEGDNELAVLEFNYGKYLTIAGSRDGKPASENGTDFDIPISQPLNLTGKWNAALSASWNGKYTVNINTEMNYWSAQPLGLEEAEKPLIDTFDDLAKSGSITAAYQYGIFNERGDDTYQPGDPWVMHHNYDLWRGTQPIDNATAGLWPTGGIWLLDHAWQYYKFNLDEEYLAEVYPYMVGAAKFFTQFLVVDPQTGYLITAASCSPEQGGVQPGPAMDTQLIRNLYDTVLQASEILGKTEENSALIAKIKEQMPSRYLADEKGKVAPNRIDSSGLIQEWVRGDVGFDFSTNSTSGKYTVTNPFKGNAVAYINEHTASNNSGHRHCSSLWEIYPGTHLSAYSSDANEKKIYEAYKKSVKARGAGSGQGWGVAWRIALNARALDGDTASAMLEQLLTTRTSPNMFDQHPNFQIDGNYGATAGMIEMLLQSHDGNIAILPAIPSKWRSGEYKDLKARGDVRVSAKWNDGKLTKAVVKPAHDGKLSIVIADAENAKIYDKSGNAVVSTLNGAITSFNASAGEEYTVVYGAFTEEYDYTIERAEFNDGLLDVQVRYNGSSSDPAASKLAAAQYDKNGVLVKVKTFDIKNSCTVNTYISQPAEGSVKVMVWDNMETMKPIAAAVTAPYVDPSAPGEKPGFTPQPTIDPNATPAPTPTPTPEPTKPPMPTSNSWTASSADDAKAAGDYVMRNMTLMFNVTASGNTSKVIDGKTFSHYISSADNGRWSSTGATGTALKYEAAEDGTLTVYVVDLGKDKELCITKEGVSNNKENTDDSAYYKNGTGASDNKSISLSVKAGNVYYAYVAGSKGHLAGAEFISTGGTVTAPPTEKPTPTPTAEPGTGGVFIGDTEYASVNAAVAAAGTPLGENERVTIDLLPGVYREQVVVKAPYVTIRKKPGTEGEAKLTWYYGLGTLYDSCNSSGYYDASVIGDQEAYGPRDWGAALKVDKSATAFNAENITIENSYNNYYTQEELTDIAGVDPDTNNSMFHRLEWIKEQIDNGKSDDEINAYLKTRTNITYKGVEASPRERCAALHCSADKAQFIGCTVTSTQDTIGINSGRMYFKDCVLAGTTDYICGSATAVFDSCELRVNAGATGDNATITAPSNPAGSEGYLFYNCHITGTQYATAGGSTFGRPWGESHVAASYINTTIDTVGGKVLISDAGWTDMSANKPETSAFTEYGSKDSSGNAVNTSKRRAKVLNEWSMLRYNPLVFTQGADGWDPAGLTERYAGVNDVINSTVIDTSDAAVNTVVLPEPPDGYEFMWESDSEFAEVKNGNIELIRPAYGEEPIKATVKLYVRKTGTEIGAEKSISFKIEPSSDLTNVFTISGTVELTPASDEDQIITIMIMSGTAVIKKTDVPVAAGETSVSYTVENIPAGEYTVCAATANADYNILTDPRTVTGTAGGSAQYNVAARKMKTIKTELADSFTADIAAADGFAAGEYRATGEETAHLGEDNMVYRLTKDEGKTVPSSTGVSFDLIKMLPEGGTLENTKTIRFSYDFLMESTALYPSDYSYFDLASSKTNAGGDKADNTRFVRVGVYKNWGQLNMFTALNGRVNGDKTHFDKNNTMANRWYRIITDIDIETKTITTTICDRDNDMEILNGKPFTIAAPDEEGVSAAYPANASLTDLYFNVYMNKSATTNRMEYYFDNITLEYQDYE